MSRGYDHYGDCRLLAHSWDFIDSHHWNSRLEGVKVTLRCERCGTERRESWSSTTGARMTKHYVYPQGYSLAFKITGVTPPSRDELRLWALADSTVAARRTALRSVPVDRRKRRAG